jgi:hypothetical protein
MKEEFLDVMTLKQKILVTTAAIKSGQNTQSLEITAGAFGIKIFR